MARTSLEELLQECVEPLRPYLDQLVVAGGWVPYLYTKVYGGVVDNEPLLTADFDVAIVRSDFIEGELSLDSSILDSGFCYDFASLDKPPVVKYVKDLEGGQRAEIEFITEAAGRGAVEVVGSVNAQALRHVGLLLDEPITCSLQALGFAEDGMLRLPRPSRFIIHKVLVAPRRRHRDKTAKDLYYAFYVLDSFPHWRDAVLEGLVALAAESPGPVETATLYLEEMFGDVDSDGVGLLVWQRPRPAYRLMSEDQFRRYALNRMRQLHSALLAGS